MVAPFTEIYKMEGEAEVTGKGTKALKIQNSAHAEEAKGSHPGLFQSRVWSSGLGTHIWSPSTYEWYLETLE